MVLSIKEESEDHTGIDHNFTNLAFAPEAEIVITGEVVLDIL